ncbi:hypothetical protein [Plantibacter sp. CFBP 8804]|uniref:hypothetical protein n=1 Tax=Plantibacter sp. CFBP 8804 TaxID=2775270 RepID=UPI00177DEB70|nr:hypothetical protein [Plantibacter sp. CFBP 8804]MBD8518630.1 hypothetical protein [Plantibacter sp. CFBP 8804]
MRTTTPTTTPTTCAIGLLTLTALAVVCVWLGPSVYRALQVAGTAVLALVVVIATARATAALLRDLASDDE